MKRRAFILAAGLTTLSACLPGPIGQVLPAHAAPAEKAARQPSTEDRFEVRNLEGWTLYINRDVPQQYPEQTATTLEHLGWELYRIKLATPALAVCNMQEHNAIWIENQEEVDLSYHPERSWLFDRGYTIPRDPQSFMSLSVKTHVGDSYRHPFVVFHELAHGYARRVSRATSSPIVLRNLKQSASVFSGP